MEAQFLYQMVKQGLEDEMKLLKTRLSDNTGTKAANAEALGKAKGELAYTTLTKQADEARLQGQATECHRGSWRRDGRDREGKEDPRRGREVLLPG